MDREYVHIDGIDCTVRGRGGGDPTPQNVLVYVYGDVKYVRFLNCTHIADICDGSVPLEWFVLGPSLVI